MNDAGDSIDIDSFWEYSDPAASEGRFRAALSSAQGDERLELLTQIARTYGLRQRFDEAHEILRELEAEHTAMGSVDGYVVEEIAENLAALGNPEEAGPYFKRAFDELSKDDWFVKNEASRLEQLEARAGKG